MSALLVVLLAASALPGGELDPQTRVFYNARSALREDKPKEVLKLWLLRNALESKGVPPTSDEDFRSLLWAALGSTGYCHDGILDDRDGAGLWPLGLHNWATKASSRRPAAPQVPPFAAYDAGYQNRFISLHDVLSLEELKGVRFFRGTCFRPWLTLPWLRELQWLDMRDRLSVALHLRNLIVLAESTLVHDKIRTRAVLTTRRFDLDLAIAQLARRKIRRETGFWGQLGRSLGVSATAVALSRERQLAEFRESDRADLLVGSLDWSAEEWLSLSEKRRLALFSEVDLALGEDVKKKRDAAVLRLIDALIAQKRGRELNYWLGFAARAGPEAEAKVAGPGGARDEVLLAKITEGARGQRLLALDNKTEFKDHATIALRRGVKFLERGEQLEAIRAFSTALGRSADGRAAENVHRLSQRWLSYVLAQYETDDEVIAILKSLVPPRDTDVLLEDLLYRAAFHQDPASFDRVAYAARRTRRLAQRIERLRPLSRGDAGKTFEQLAAELEEKPHLLVAFIKELTSELALESIDVRKNNATVLELSNHALSSIYDASNNATRAKVDKLSLVVQALLDGVERYDSSAQGRADRADPDYEAYGGSLRLAPADPLPFPFTPPVVSAPSPFAPIKLVPVEWKDKEGEIVFGFRLTE